MAVANGKTCSVAFPQELDLFFLLQILINNLVLLVCGSQPPSLAPGSR